MEVSMYKKSFTHAQGVAYDKSISELAVQQFHCMKKSMIPVMIADDKYYFRFWVYCQ